MWYFKVLTRLKNDDSYCLINRVLNKAAFLSLRPKNCKCILQRYAIRSQQGIKLKI